MALGYAPFQRADLIRARDRNGRMWEWASLPSDADMIAEVKRLELVYMQPMTAGDLGLWEPDVSPYCFWLGR